MNSSISAILGNNDAGRVFRAWRIGMYPRLRWIDLAGLMVFLLAGCAGGQSSAGPIHLHSESSRLQMITPELMCKAILVMDVGVASLGQAHWNTPDGTRPASADALTLASNGYRIFTPIHFSHMHIHVDYRSQPTKEFATVGGRVGSDVDEESYPQVKPQQNYLLTLVYGIQAEQGEIKNVLIVNDAFPIDAQGIVTLRPAHTEFGPGGKNQVENFPAITRPLAQIVQELADCK
jgi:hypothetical protein